MRKATNIQNLKPFKKGQSGNPAGRPKKLPAIDEILAKVMSETDESGHTRTEKILRKMAIKAETSERAAELILERSYGKIRQATDLNVEFDSLTDEALERIATSILNNL